MNLSVLGPVSAYAGDTSLVPSARQPRNALAMLMVRLNQIVGIGDLEKEIWGDTPPRTAQTVLQTHMMNLRKKLAHGLDLPMRQVAEEVLVTCEGGYSLKAAGDNLDLESYFRLVNEGSTALTKGSTESASRKLRRALALWRGPALADINGGSVLTSESERLNTSALVTRIQCIFADLRLNRDYKLLFELSSLTSLHRTNEILHGQYMVGLYRTGFRTEALKAYDHLRQALVNDLGLEPSAELQRVHQAVLAADGEMITSILRTNFAPTECT